MRILHLRAWHRAEEGSARKGHAKVRVEQKTHEFEQTAHLETINPITLIGGFLNQILNQIPAGDIHLISLH